MLANKGNLMKDFKTCVSEEIDTIEYIKISYYRGKEGNSPLFILPIPSKGNASEEKYYKKFIKLTKTAVKEMF